MIPAVISLILRLTPPPAPVFVWTGLLTVDSEDWILEVLEGDKDPEAFVFDVFYALISFFLTRFLYFE